MHPVRSTGILKNVGQLAKALGVSPCFIKRMKYAGFPMPGGRSTVEWALEWLRANPGFKQSEWTKRHQGGARQQGLGADK
jgi:hypothetical protein